MPGERTVVKNKVFGNKERVSLDDREFIGCTFNGCTMVFGGGEVPLIADCSLNGVDFDFEGSALRTVHFCRWLTMVGGKDVVVGYLTRNREKMN